jgi:peroxiredoxin
MLALAAIALPSAGLLLHPGHDEAGPGELPQVGQKAPDVQLPGTDGKGHWLRSYRGKKHVVLAFFPKANTAG